MRQRVSVPISLVLFHQFLRLLLHYLYISVSPGNKFSMNVLLEDFQGKSCPRSRSQSYIVVTILLMCFVM